MGVGRIFSRGALEDFSKIFPGGKSGEICLFFSNSKLRKPFFLKFSNARRVHTNFLYLDLNSTKPRMLLAY